MVLKFKSLFYGFHVIDNKDKGCTEYCGYTIEQAKAKHLKAQNLKSSEVTFVEVKEV